MKPNHYMLLLFVFMIPALADAQNDAAKQNYITTQSYLSENTLQTYTSLYGDSLQGFDEAAVKAYLLSNNVSGSEYITCMRTRKQAFIYKKYYQVLNLQTPAPSYDQGQRVIGGNNTTQNLPCINEGFEDTPVGLYAGASNSTAISGWTISSDVQLNGGCSANSFTPGSPEASVVNTPVFSLPGLGTLPNSPLGGNKVVRLNDANGTGLQTRIMQTFPVTSSNTFLQVAFAGAWKDGGHPCCGQAGVKIRIYDCTGTPLSCQSLTAVALGSGCPSGSGTTSFSVTSTGPSVTWSNWQVKGFDLTPFIGSCITLEVITYDCTFGADYGFLFLDTRCSGAGSTGSGIGPFGADPITQPMSFCAGSGQAILQAPPGYNTYQWVSPTTGSIAASQGGAAQTLTVSNPVSNSVYSVNLSTSAGCFFVGTYTIAPTTTGITGISTTSTCIGGGSNGSATVVAGGSSTGYTYAWLNASNTIVSTSSVLSNAPPGVYTASVTSPGPNGCGTATSSATISAGPAAIINIIKPFCGTAAYLQSPLPGTNFKWYNGNTAIPAAQGGTAPAYTVTSPFGGIVYWLSYHTNQGCQDSVKFTLVQSNNSSMAVSNNLVCPGITTGQAIITVSPATFYSAAAYSLSVISTGTTSSYALTINPTGLSTYTAPNLSVNGTYSVTAFDGSCYSASTFSVGMLTGTFGLSVVPSATICPGGPNPVVSVTATPSAAYNYSWSPSSSVFSPGLQSTSVVQPTVSVGSATGIVYTVTVSPAAAYCPQTQTLMLTFVNPALPPTVNAIPSLCSHGPNYTITANPPGGNFYAAGGTLSGVISPSLTNTGTNTFTYSILAGGCTVSATGSFVVNLSPGFISPVPAMCSNAPNYTITAIPPGGHYDTPPTSAPSPIGLTSGILTPALAHTGVNTFTYTLPNMCSFTASYVINPVPVISPIPALCSNAPEYTITATPPGGSFSTSSGSSIGLTSGILSASLAQTGVNTFTYALNSCTATSSYVINAAPVIILTGNDIACAGETLSWQATGADTYAWSPLLTGPGTLIAPAVTTVYTVTATNANNCSATKTKTLTIDLCTVIQALVQQGDFKIYPNPAVDEVTIETSAPLEIVLYNELGSLILEENLQSGTSVINMSHFSSGMYLLKTTGNGQVKITKVIKVKN